MNNAMEAFLEGCACAFIVAVILATVCWGVQNDPAFDPDRAPHSPTNMGKAWVPE